MIVGKCKREYEPGGALHQGALRPLATRADNEITLPVFRGRPILNLGETLREHYHIGSIGAFLTLALGRRWRSPSASTA